MRFRSKCQLAIAVVVFASAGCVPNGPWTAETSPASGFSVPAQLSGSGGGHVANIFVCGDVDDTVEITLSGLSDASYGVTIAVRQLDSSGFAWSHVDYAYHSGVADGDTVVFPPSDPLPFTGCFNVSMNTGSINGGDDPSPFEYLVVW